MLSISQITKIPVQINGLIDSEENIGIIDPHITRDVLEEWLDTHTFKFNPYWYQFECLYYALKYRLSRCEVATAGGKSFTIFLYCRYLLETGRVKSGDKILVITIRRMLVTQMKSDIEEYQSTDTPLLKCDTVFSGGRKFADSNVVIGTYQTLSGYDKEYFDLLKMTLYQNWISRNVNIDLDFQVLNHWKIRLKDCILKRTLVQFFSAFQLLNFRMKVLLHKYK